jgi:DNA-3-methyladenine glycosylase II
MKPNKTHYKSISDKVVWRAGIKHLSKNDKILKKIIKKSGGLEIWREAKKWWEPDHYGSIVRSIIFQQISGSAGNSILKRFKSLYGGKFPSPKQFLKTEGKKVRDAGISPQKYSYLKDLCERIEDGRLEMNKFQKMDDEDIIKELDEVKGIGRWTAEMYLIGTLRRIDVLPVDDLGIRKAVQKAYKLKRLPDREKLIWIARKWSPYKTVASIYLWTSMD